MRPMKPRPAGSAHDALVEAIAAIALGLGRDREAGPKLAADFLDCSPSLIHKATDPDCRETIGFSKVDALAQHFPGFAEEMAQHFALRAGGQFIPAPSASPRDWEQLLIEAPEDVGRAISDAYRARERIDSLTPAECHRIGREFLSLMSLIAGVASPFIESVPRSPVIAMPSG
jgi:hypothetical protein